jgi:hypothetical protein
MRISAFVQLSVLPLALVSGEESWSYEYLIGNTIDVIIQLIQAKYMDA